MGQSLECFITHFNGCLIMFQKRYWPKPWVIITTTCQKNLTFFIASSGRVADLLEETKDRGRLLGRAVFLLEPVLTGGGFANWAQEHGYHSCESWCNKVFLVLITDGSHISWKTRCSKAIPVHVSWVTGDAPVPRGSPNGQTAETSPRYDLDQNQFCLSHQS